jgi:hypothetical protein
MGLRSPIENENERIPYTMMRLTGENRENRAIFKIYLCYLRSLLFDSLRPIFSKEEISR